HTVAQADLARPQEPAGRAVMGGAGPEALGQELERVRLRNSAVEVGEHVQARGVESGRQRGKASGTPPSTGSVAPVVGLRFEAKKTTALPTCAPVTFALSRLRWR